MTKLIDKVRKGTSLSRGVAFGPLHYFNPKELKIKPKGPIAATEVEAECLRFQQALEKSRLDLERIRDNLVQERVQEGVQILEAHLQMLYDPGLIRTTEMEIRSLKWAEEAFQSVIDTYVARFFQLKDPFFRERANDVKDIARRVIGHLCELHFDQWEILEEPSILVAEELSSTLVAELSPKRVVGLITTKGSITSHSAILARAKGIPFVSGIELAELIDKKVEKAIIDAAEGKVVLDPSRSSEQAFLSMKAQLESEMRNFVAARDLKAETFDGFEVCLSANIDVDSELDLIHQFGAHGVGLFRSEYIFLKSEKIPSEEEQFKIYKGIVEKMKGRPIVIRTFDVGGDKGSFQTGAREANPYLGCRAIRFLLKEKKIFRTQLRAILRAAVYGDVAIMFPMVSGLSELKEAKKLLLQIEDELEKEGLAHRKQIRLGSMIEVPSAAIIADLIAKECDFLSIGTNDLVQYSLAVDRGNEHLSSFYTPTHPGVIRLIKTIVTEANRQGIPVTLCGEIAADPRFTPLLLGLGVQLSVAVRHIPIIKQQVRLTSIIRAAHLAEEALNLGDPEEIAALLESEYRKSRC